MLFKKYIFRFTYPIWQRLTSLARSMTTPNLACSSSWPPGRQSVAPGSCGTGKHKGDMTSIWIYQRHLQVPDQEVLAMQVEQKSYPPSTTASEHNNTTNRERPGCPAPRNSRVKTRIWTDPRTGYISYSPTGLVRVPLEWSRSRSHSQSLCKPW